MFAGGDCPRMDHPSGMSTPSPARSALESCRNWASWWIHVTVIRLAQGKHTRHRLACYSQWQDGLLCECPAMCLSLTVSASVDLFGIPLGGHALHFSTGCVQLDHLRLAVKGPGVNSIYQYSQPTVILNQNTHHDASRYSYKLVVIAWKLPS